MTGRFDPEPIVFVRPDARWRVVLVQHERRDGSRYWMAETEVDGRVWNLDCTHQHHSLPAALKCAFGVARRFEALAGGETFVVDHQNEVVEFRRVEVVENGRSETGRTRWGTRTWTQRISPSRDIVRVLDADEVRARRKNLPPERKVS